MPVYAPAWTPLVLTGNYPHMAKHDAVIWERFLTRYGGNYESVAYDVALGGFQLAEDKGTEAERLGWQYTTALKIDAVAQGQGETWIIEVKPQAGVSAIGAALVYSVLAELDRFSPWPLVPCVVTDATTPDIQRAASLLGVTIVVVPEG